MPSPWVSAALNRRALRSSFTNRAFGFAVANGSVPSITILPAPLPNQGRTGLQHDARKEGTSAFLELSCQDLEAALQRPAQAAIGPLLQLIGEPPDHQIATEPLRRFSAMKLAPGDAQVMRRSINHLGNLAIY